jgi:outer membrane murein-binding lipoprotein Lpp
MSENILVDPNTANEESLAQIPGVGEELAKRILMSRPYTSLDDMQRVNGIGPAFLEKLAPYIEIPPAETVSVGGDGAVVEQNTAAERPPAETEDPSPEKETSTDEEPLTPAIEPPDDDVSLPEIASSTDEIEPSDQDTTSVDEDMVSEVEPPATAVPPAYTTRGQAFLMSCGCSTIALILALVIGIGALAGLNNGNLLFATPAQVSKLALEVERIDKEVKGIEQDLDGLQSRVNNLEGLTSRMDEVEQIAKDLGTHVTSITSQVAEMDQEVQELATGVETLQAESARYQDFFSGLRELLSKVILIEEESDEQQPK